MTTIVAVPELIASDSSFGVGNRTMRNVKYCDKLWARDGSVFGAAGTVGLTEYLKQYVKKSHELDEADEVWLYPEAPAPDLFYSTLRINGHEVYYGENGLPECRSQLGYDAVGSGSDIALALLRMGFDPRYILEQLFLMDPSTSGPVQFKFAKQSDLELEEFQSHKTDDPSITITTSSVTKRITYIGPNPRPNSIFKAKIDYTQTELTPWVGYT